MQALINHVHANQCHYLRLGCFYQEVRGLLDEYELLHKHREHHENYEAYYNEVKGHSSIGSMHVLQALNLVRDHEDSHD